MIREEIERARGEEAESKGLPNPARIGAGARKTVNVFD
jgi:hypothetical protein